jgi:hypothetical protein
MAIIHLIIHEMLYNLCHSYLPARVGRGMIYQFQKFIDFSFSNPQTLLMSFS